MVRVFLLATLLGAAVCAFPGYGYRPTNPGVTPYQEDFAPRKHPLPNAFVSNNEYEAPAAAADDGYDAAAPQEAEPEAPEAGGNGEYQAQPSEYDTAARQQGGAPEYEQEAPVSRRGEKNEDFDAPVYGGQSRFRGPADMNNDQPMSALQTGQFVKDATNTQQLQQQMQQQLAQLKQLRAQQLQLQRLQAQQQQAPAANTPAPRSGDDNGPTMPTEAPSKLDLALMAVKDDIMKKSRQVEQEVGWITQVKAITSSYADKMTRVEDNVNSLRNEVKDLYSKKKQIQNLQMQKKLKERLEDATQDLSTVTKALGHVQTKESEFQRTRDNIQSTIYNIRTTLQGLNGQGVAGVDDDSDEKVENDIASEVKDEKPANDELGGWTEELKAARVESAAP